MFVTTGDSRNIDTVHHNVDGRADAQHDTEVSNKRGRREPRQSAVRHGGAVVHHMVHARILAPVQCVAQQMEVLQGWPERHRLAGHTAVLRVPDTGGRDGQDGSASVRRRPPGDTDIPDHAHTSYTEISPAFYRFAESWVHVAQLVQRAGPAHAVLGHGRVDIFQPGVFCRERGA